MAVTYVRRFRMEIDLGRGSLPLAELPDGYVWTRWDDSLVERHSVAKYLSFHEELDARVFPCLGELEGCRRLMGEISRQCSFLPGATWLITREPNGFGPPVDCGTIQGLAHSRGLGAVQNVGVVPEHRGSGLGRALVLQSLHGFRNARLLRVYLEVTAENKPAVELYRSIGFRHTRTMYKPLAAETAAPL